VTSSNKAATPNSALARIREWFPAQGPATIWAAQPFTVGPLVGDALDPTLHTFRTATTWMVWLSWLAVLIILAIPRPLTLTLGRIAVPAIVPATVWAALVADSPNSTIIIGLVSAALVTLVVLLPVVGEHFIDAASYGDERRFVLRPQGPVLVFLLVPTWAITVAAITAGPLLLADQYWLAGAIAVAAGAPAALVGYRALSRVTSRFVVFVPNGVVIHDYGALAEPVLFKTHEIAALGPARADTTASDITSQALGLAIEMRFTEPIKLPMVTSRGHAEEQPIAALMFSASRPAALLATAADRGFVIG